MNIPLGTEKKTGKEQVRKMRQPTWTTQPYRPLVPHSTFSRVSF